MWSQQISVGCMCMWTAWGIAFMLIGAGWSMSIPALGQTGLASSAAAAALTVMRDNQRTRRMIHANERRRVDGGLSTVR